MSNWSEPRPFRLFSEALPKRQVKGRIEQQIGSQLQRQVRGQVQEQVQGKKLAPKVAPQPKPLPKKPEPPKAKTLSTENLDAMLHSIDAQLDLCSKTPAPLKIAVKAPDHPFYVRLKSAIAAHIGEVVDEGADLVLGKGGDIELLEPEAYTPDKKRALWDELKKRAQRQ